MKRGIISLILLVAYCKSFSQKYVFVSNFEKECIERRIKNEKTLFLESLFFVDSTSNRESFDKMNLKVDEFISSFRNSKAYKQKPKKKLKNLYELVHDRFLKKYEIESYFSDIFKTGNYNCVSATALYAYVFSELDIDYTVKETPSHVFLIAYPEDEGIYIETTLPGENGYVEVSDKMINKAVDYLLSTKLISQDEVKSKGAKSIYYEYYYGNEDISAESLIGMQYYNKSVFSYLEGEPKQANNNIDKALLYYSKAEVKLYKQFLLKEVLKESDFIKIDDLNLFVDFINLHEESTFDKGLINYPIVSLVQNTEISDIDSVLPIFELIKLEGVKKEVYYQLFEHCARYAGDEGDYVNGLKYAKRAYEIKPKNKFIHKILSFFLLNDMSKDIVDENLLQRLNDCKKEYSFINKKIAFSSLEIAVHGKLSYELYSTTEIDKAEWHLSELEKIINDKPNALVRKEVLAELYLKAGKYYYRNDKNNQAKLLFEKGLKVSPANRDMKRFLNWVKEDL